MAFMSYGGRVYRNGIRRDDRCNATIPDQGKPWGTPGEYPAFAAVADGATMQEAKAIMHMPHGHALLGDGPIYAMLYKQQDVRIYRGQTRLDECALIQNPPPEAFFVWVEGGKQRRQIESNYYVENNTPCVMEIDGHRLEVFFLYEDNYYQYARFTQPDGTVWHGWSGYAVGACDRHPEDDLYFDEDRDATLRRLWPDSIVT